MTAAALLDELRGLGIELQAHGDRLRFRPRSAVTDELLARLQAHKGELLEMLHGGNGYTTPAISDNRHGSVVGEALDIIDIPDPCPDCGGIEVWQDLAGGWHCERCKPRRQGDRLRRLAPELRERAYRLRRLREWSRIARSTTNTTKDTSDDATCYTGS